MILTMRNLSTICEDADTPDVLEAPTIGPFRFAAKGHLAYRLVWVNPHSGRDGYEPLTGGMAAALPHLDDSCAATVLRPWRMLCG
ncbi:hypothetical protein [Rugosimonospora acidiphila]|uniref:hypothetical protein n=1 Tax=Rugosimonospora acidiphila TaxID=556531 RepID=UPI0031EE64EA